MISRSKKKVLIIVNLIIAFILLITIFVMLFKVKEGEDMVRQNQNISNVSASSENFSDYKIEDYVSITKRDDIAIVPTFKSCEVDKIEFKNIPDEVVRIFLEEQESIKNTLENAGKNIYALNSARRVDIKSNTFVQINGDILSVYFELKIPVNKQDKMVVNNINIDLKKQRAVGNIELMQGANYMPTQFAEEIYNIVTDKDLTEYIDLKDDKELGQRYRENKQDYINRVIFHINDLHMYIKDKEVYCLSTPDKLVGMLEIEKKLVAKNENN